jgi:hypothetical protein
MLPSSIHLPVNDKISFFFKAKWYIIAYIYLYHISFFYKLPKGNECLSFIHQWILIVVLGVHCGIYKSSYYISNISQLNSYPPSFSFIPLPPFLELFQQVSFFNLYTCVHSNWTRFTQLHPFLTSSSSNRSQTPSSTYSAHLFSHFVKKEKNAILVCHRKFSCDTSI